MATEQKEKEKVPNEEPKKDFIKSPTIIETTYEKVLSIINKVKEFIKKTSTDPNNLIQDLEWVIKVITNKSLYTYELKQEKLSKQNAEYNKFISFVTKYNEEVIEMNKKHDIVSGILSIGKKGDMLLKPSLCLKKILPDELKNMDEQVIKEKKFRKNNFIYVFGNTILNLYNKEMAKRKSSIENTENSGSIDKCNYNSLDNPVENKNDNINITKEESKNVSKDNQKKSKINKNNKSIENNKTSDPNINKNKNIVNIKKKLNEKEEIKNEKNDNVDKIKNKQKSDNLIDKDNRNNGMNMQKYNTDENYNSDIFNEQRLKSINSISDKKNFNINIQRIRIAREKEKLSDSKIKFKSNNLSHKKNIKRATKLTKYEQITFNSIKKAMKNYYIKFAYNEGKGTNMEIYELKGNFNSNNNNRHLYKTNYNSNFNLNDMSKKFRSTNIDRAFMSYKNSKYTTFPHNMINYNRKKNKNNNLYNQKSEDIFKNYKIVKSLKENLIFESNENKFDNIVYETSHNINNKNKFHLSKRFQITAEKKKDNLSEKEMLKSFKTENNQLIKANNSEKSIINKNKIIKKEEINKNIEDNNNKNVNNKNNVNNKSNINNTNDKNIKKQNNSQISIINLVDKYFEEVKMITDKDFHIFDFKDKVGHKNVLPMMGYVILKTLGLLDGKIISSKKIDSFLTTVSDNYKMSTLYHNSLHGADVTQSLCVYFLNSNAEEICETTVLDLLGMMVSAMGHDLGHPGLNNNFHINASTDLAITYNDASCLENFHTSYLFKILRKEDNNILEKFSVQNYKSIRKRMISQILATDMANHGETISLIRSKIKAWQEVGGRFNLLSGNEKTKFDEQQLLLNYMIHMADLGHNCKKFEISLIWVKLLCEEFWQQGDKEKAKGLPISFMCDRDKIDVPASQVGFLRGFILSSFDCLVAMFPNLKYTVENADNNIKRWKKLQDEKRLLGWTPKKEKKEDEEKKDENKDKKGNENLEIKKEEEKNEEIKKKESKNEETKIEENENNEIKKEEIKKEDNDK